MDKEPLKTAFPHDSNWEDRQGMTLRDYFAAKAMQGLIMRNDYRGSNDQYAEAAYEMADAMLKAREQ